MKFSWASLVSLGLCIGLAASCKSRGMTNSGNAKAMTVAVDGEGPPGEDLNEERSPDESYDLSMEQAELNLDYPAGLAIPDVIGTQYANNLNQKDIEMISALGFKYIRIVVHTTQTEAVFVKRYDPLIFGMWNKSITPIITIVNAGNMDDAAVRDGYIKGIAAVASRYKDGPLIWDVYNEPTSPTFWPTKCTPQVFADWADKMITVVRMAAPQHKVMMPSIQRLDSTGINFLMGVFTVNPGLLSRIDYVAVHTYGPASGAGPFDPETKARAISALRTQVKTKFGKSPPFVVSEFGWHTYGGGSVSKAMQGVYAPRLILANMEIGLPMTIYYEWRDDPSEIAKAEPGILTIDYQPRPGYVSLKALADNLRGYTLQAVMTKTSTHMLRFVDSAGTRKIAAWAETGGARNVTLIGKAGKKMTLNGVSTSVKYYAVPASVIF